MAATSPWKETSTSCDCLYSSSTGKHFRSPVSERTLRTLNYAGWIVLNCHVNSTPLRKDVSIGVDGAPDFYRMTANKPGVFLMDATTGSVWNSQGCAVSGKA